MKDSVTHALAGFVAGLALLAAIALVTGCASKKPVHVNHGAHYAAHFDPAKCKYLPDGIRFVCNNVVFDPQEIDAHQ